MNATMENWDASKLDFRKFMDQFPIDDSLMVEVDEEIYYYFLGVVPPSAVSNDGFLCGEPTCHNRTGKPVYDAFIKSGDRFFYAWGMTRESFLAV